MYSEMNHLPAGLMSMRQLNVRCVLLPVESPGHCEPPAREIDTVHNTVHWAKNYTAIQQQLGKSRYFIKTQSYRENPMTAISSSKVSLQNFVINTKTQRMDDSPKA